MRKCVVAAIAAILFAGPARAQISGVGAILHPLNPHESDTVKNLTTYANGPRLVSSGGGIWFLESNADRIAFYKDDVITEWPIRSRSYSDPYRHIAATPADFELDGTNVWFIENGESGIEIGESVFGKLDTTTNQLTEWILPVSKPAGFLRDPDGVTVWVAMSQGSLVRFNLETLKVSTFRAADSLAYSGIVRGPDGAIYLSDFGNNRIVRFDAGASEETSWQLYDPTKGRLQITQPTFDSEGNMYVAEYTNGGAIGRLNLSTGDYVRYGGGVLYYPTHFFLQGSQVYGVETDPLGGDGQVIVIDRNRADSNTLTSVMATGAMSELPARDAVVRTVTLTPITFQSSDQFPDGSVVAGAPATGISLFTLPHGTQFPSTTSYSITVVDGKVVCGVRGALAEFTLLPPAGSEELVVPFAMNQADGSVRTDFLISDTAAPSGPLTAGFYVSPAPPPFQKLYTVPADNTLRVADALGASQLAAGDAEGSLRFSPTVGDEGNYQIAVRTYAVRPDGGTYGFALPAVRAGDALSGASPDAVVFLQAEAGETSIFGLYSPTGAQGTATLHGPDGRVRGTYTFFLPSNNHQEFNPAFTAFNVPAETGDTITFSLDSGSVVPYGTLAESTGDAAVATAAAPTTLAVFPSLGTAAGVGGASYESTVLLSNPDPQTPAQATVTLYPPEPGAPASVVRTIPPGGSAAVPFADLGNGFGTVVVQSPVPVAALARVANHTSTGDFAGLVVPGSRLDRRFLVAGNDGRLLNHVVLFNGGSAGTVTVTGFDSAGNTRKTLTFPIGALRPLVIANVDVLLQIYGGGRIEVKGSAGTYLFSSLASRDRITGDPDGSPGFPITAPSS